MINMIIKKYIFDFDGTIVDSKEIAINIYNELSKKYGYRIIDDDKIAELKSMDILGKIKHMGVPMTKIPRLYKEANRMYKEEIDKVNIIPGIKDVIVKLSENNRLFIVSSNDSKIIKKVLLDYKILKYFQEIFSSKKLFNKHKILKKIANGKDAIYIGDETRDINAAKKAGIISGGATWGYEDIETLAGNCPDYLFEEPSEILKVNTNDKKSS